MQNMDYAYFRSVADFVKNVIKDEPEVGIILGSGLKKLASRITEKIVVDYKDIPGFLESTVESHEGKLVFGRLGNKKVICMSGRFHHYEGYPFTVLTIPVRLFKLLGVKKTIVTNAAGAVNTEYNVGDIMIIKDHLKLTGASPLEGDNIEEFGPRFFDTTDMYTKELREIALNCTEGSPLTFREGVYMYFTGPQFETPAEIRAARILGADAVGMSTVPEVIVANHCGIKVFGVSVITDLGVEGKIVEVTHEEVQKAADAAQPKMTEIMRELINRA